MRILPVALAIFYEFNQQQLRVWVQTREDDGPFYGLQEFPGGGIEPGELPLEAAVREVAEEVGIVINQADGKLFGVYPNELVGKTVLLHVFLFPVYPALTGKGRWLTVESKEMSAPFKGLIPPPNHKIIDDLFLALLS